MRNPWLDIPLADYEAHMSSPDIAQAQLLAAQFEIALKHYQPKSVAVFGCAGGNGFDRIDPRATQCVVAIDISSDYINKVRGRFATRFTKFVALVADIQSLSLNFDPVDLIYAGLIFEYVDVEATMNNIRRLLNAKGTLVTLVQLPNANNSNVSASAYPSLQTLEPHLRLVSPTVLRAIAERNSFSQITSVRLKLESGKEFQLQGFQRV